MSCSAVPGNMFLTSHQAFASDDESELAVDETLIETLADCYHAATLWETRRQILSIMADRVS